ncbi:MAG TPA: hypothetical protein VEV20_01895 [Burkholderiales bacterium]|nr:hypothetical protein [Burkholderiales bacterium]
MFVPSALIADATLEYFRLGLATRPGTPRSSIEVMSTTAAWPTLEASKNQPTVTAKERSFID